MSIIYRIAKTIFLLLTTIPFVNGQIFEHPKQQLINADSFRAEYDKAPYFGLYKDNYFIFGTSLNHKPSKENTNVKFQVSIQQKLTKSTLLAAHTFTFIIPKKYFGMYLKSHCR